LITAVSLSLENRREESLKDRILKTSLTHPPARPAPCLSCLHVPPSCGTATHSTYPTKAQQFLTNRDFSSFLPSYKALRRFTAIEFLKNPSEEKRKQKEGNQFSKYI